MTTTDPTDRPAEPASEYVGREQAAEMLGITIRQLDRLVAERKVTKYTRPVGRFKVGYKPAELRALIEPAPND